MYIYNVCIKKEESFKTNALLSHFKKLRKINKPKSKKNAIKVRAKIDKMKNK